MLSRKRWEFAKYTPSSALSGGGRGVSNPNGQIPTLTPNPQVQQRPSAPTESSSAMLNDILQKSLNSLPLPSSVTLALSPTENIGSIKI